MKLSLYSQLVRNGEHSEAVYNAGEMGRKLFDVKIEGMLKLSPDNKEPLCLLSLNNLGCMVYLIKPLFSRMGDYRSLVLAVPRQVVFSASTDIENIVDGMRQVLFTDQGTDKLKRWFERDYPENDFHWSLPASGNRYAYRTYGPHSKASNLGKLLGMAMLQPYYGEYEGVFLLPENMAGILRQEAMTNLTDNALSRPAIVNCPPSSALPAGVTLWVGDEEMRQPVLSHVGGALKCHLRKKGRVDYDFTYKVSEVSGRVNVPAGVEWQVKVPTSIFRFLDEEGNELDKKGITMNIDGITAYDKKNQCFTIPENLAKRANVTVTREGCVPRQMVADLTKYSTASPLTMNIERVRSKVKYKVGRKITFELDRTDEELNKSPLPDYEIGEKKGNVITLRRKASSRRRNPGKDDGEEGKSRGWNVSRWALYRIGTGLLCGLLLGGLLGWFFGVPHGEKVVRQQLEDERLAKEQREIEITDSLMNIQMTAYLDSVPKWKKEEMDTLFEGRMAGIYDALNTYDFKAVQTRLDELDFPNTGQLHLLDSAINAFSQKPVYLDKLKDVTKNEDEGKNKFFSPDGTITLATLMAKMGEVRSQVDKSLQQ